MPSETPAPRLIPAHPHRAEITVVNSRFIASLAPAFNVEEARAFIAQIKGEFADATHNVPVFVIGHGQSIIEHCHDDGEPSGTAGRPALAVLRGSGLGDVVAVVTRYFGGTQLGKGGLVRAYGDAIRAGLETLPRAEKIATQTVMLSLAYAWYEQVRRVIDAHHGQMLDEDFAGDITLTVRFRMGEVAGFQTALTELTHGTLRGEV
ncbi:MAG: YigZ family protein, partial [Anaerolineales bacterium]|nr:YigZ family protein [Anaerolineales bacterium]